MRSFRWWNIERMWWFLPDHPRSQSQHHRRLYLNVIWWCFSPGILWRSFEMFMLQSCHHSWMGNESTYFPSKTRSPRGFHTNAGLEVKSTARFRKMYYSIPTCLKFSSGHWDSGAGNTPLSKIAKWYID